MKNPIPPDEITFNGATYIKKSSQLEQFDLEKARIDLSKFRVELGPSTASLLYYGSPVCIVHSTGEIDTAWTSTTNDPHRGNLYDRMAGGMDLVLLHQKGRLAK